MTKWEIREHTWVGCVALGDTQREAFQLALTTDGSQVIHPVVNKAGASAQVVGPDSNCRGKCFEIDGRRDGVRAGAIYQITFTWDCAWKSVSWEPVTSPRHFEVFGKFFEHRYYLVGSWSGWNFEEMLVASGTRVATFQLGADGRERFQIARDKDRSQVLRPATPIAATTAGGSCCSPVDGRRHAAKLVDADGGQHFVAEGRPFALMTVQLLFRCDGLSVKLCVADRTECRNEARVSDATASVAAPPGIAWDGWDELEGW